MSWLSRALFALALSWSALAHADTQPELMRRAAQAEQALDFARAASLYREALSVDQSSRLARRIRARLTWLGDRSEGGYAPLAALERLRRTPRAHTSAQQIAAFAAEAARFPEGRVRRESLALLAELYLHHLDDPARALAFYHAWAQSPGLDDAEHQLAESGIALARERVGADGILSLRQAGLGHRAEASWLRSERIGKTGTWLALSALAAFVLAGLACGGWRGLSPTALLEALSPARLAAGAYILVVPVVFAWLHDPPSVHRIAWLAGACAMVLLAAAILGGGLERARASRRRRRLVAGLASLATFAAAFVALVRTQLLHHILWTWEQLP